jgi:hypothetical protein
MSSLLRFKGTMKLANVGGSLGVRRRVRVKFGLKVLADLKRCQGGCGYKNICLLPNLRVALAIETPAIDVAIL